MILRKEKGKKDNKFEAKAVKHKVAGQHAALSHVRKETDKPRYSYTFEEVGSLQVPLRARKQLVFHKEDRKALLL
jgi:hypothetical protein